MLLFYISLSAFQSIALTKFQQWRSGTEGVGSVSLLYFALFFLAQCAILNIYGALIYPRFVSPLRRIPGPAVSKPQSSSGACFTLTCYVIQDGQFFFGQAIKLFKAPTPTSLYTEWSKQHPESPLIRYLTVGGGEVVVVNSPDAFKDIMQTQCYSFKKPDRLRHMVKEFTGKGIGMLEFDEHKAHRKMLNAAFTPENVRRLEPIFQQKASEFGSLLDRAIDVAIAGGDGNGVASGIIDCTETFNKATMDVICMALFGINSDNIGGDENIVSPCVTGKKQYSFRDAYQAIFAMSTIESVLMLADSFVPLRWLPCEANRKFKTTTNWLNVTLHQIIQERRNTMLSAKSTGSHEHSRDILAHLIEQSLPGGTAEGMTDEYMVGHLLFLLLAGHDTSSNSLSWSVYTLATQPNIQERLRREVRELSSNRIASSPPSFAEIDALPYLHNVVREVLRVYPPATVMFRQAVNDVTVQGFRLPKGTAIDLSGHLGEDADEVRPERWDAWEPSPTGGGEKKQRQTAAPSPYAYEVFGNGPRVCLGKQFALMEIKMFLFAMASRYRFVGVEGEFTVANPSFVLRPAMMRVRFEKL
ncbi:cytochrome P450 3A5 [Apiospora kogelbergensis]|uniref:Cytochrome P450 3A5 n=1 Tax=Apiospora kogelbergensis TaxID=1337665 RepID=A0AAW0QI48_9PEZI